MFAYDHADNEEIMSTVRIALAAAVLGAAAALAAAESRAATKAETASPWVDLRVARVRLVAAPGVRGNAMLAGVEVTLAEGWKTYWRMPGEAGVPPTFDWEGSSNVGAVRILYPAPVRFAEPAAETIGYKHTVILPVEVTPQDAAKPVALKLAMELGVCKDICIPAQAAMSLVVPAGKAADAPPPQMAAALERVPRPQAKRRPTDPELVRASASLAGPSPRLTFEARFPGDAKDADLFVEAPEGLFVPMPKRAGEAAGGIVRFEVDLSRGGLAKDLAGKALTLTLVSRAGASEAAWTVAP
jgi:DsbC/DsbD-like thiol-disulfide interchange protein